jgi:hypothetical protein
MKLFNILGLGKSKKAKDKNQVAKKKMSRKARYTFEEMEEAIARNAVVVKF